MIAWYSSGSFLTRLSVLFGPRAFPAPWETSSPFIPSATLRAGAHTPAAPAQGPSGAVRLLGWQRRPQSLKELTLAKQVSEFFAA